MFLDFYGLVDQPFGATPDPRYLYFSRTHREAQASLWYGIHVGRGFLALVATPGMGKTTLLMQLLERLRSTARTAFLFHTQCDSQQLLRYLLGDLGLDSNEQDPVRIHEQLNQHLLRAASENRRVVVIIDEAQNLHHDVLETVRLLSDFETPREKLIQIILSGQPELAVKLARPDLAQLRQRIGAMNRLEPLSPSETALYIRHRLQVAGYRNGLLFSSPAVESIAAHSRGIPRNINTICFNALSLGCALRRKQIGPEILAEVYSDLSFDSFLPESESPAIPASPTVVAPAPVARPITLAPEAPVESPAPIAAPAPPANPVSARVPAPPAAHAPAPVPAPDRAKKPLRSAFLSHRALSKNPRIATLVQTIITLLLVAMAVVASVAFIEKIRYGRVWPAAPSGPQGLSAAIIPPASITSSPVHAAEPVSQPSNLPATSAFPVAEEASQPISHVVGPDESVSYICLHYLGRFDKEILQEILALNTDLKDPDLIVVGQRIRLPRVVSKPATVGSTGKAEPNSAFSPRKAP